MAITEQDRAWLKSVRGEYAIRSAPPASAAPPPRQNTSALQDFGTDIKRGVQKVPSAVTGLLDIPVAAVTGRPMVSEGFEKLGELTGFQPSRFADEAQVEYSPQRQQLQREAEQKEGFFDTAAHYAAKPSLLAGTVLESLPSVALGGIYARGLKGVSALGGITRAGIGEGAVMAGQSINEMVDQGVDPRRAAGFATGVGAIGGVLGVAGGRLAQRMGLADADTLLAGAGRPVLAAGAQPLGLARRVGGGVISEGLFEELPQTVVETVAGNVAAERPWDEQLGKNAAVGMLAGGVMGGAFNIPGARRQRDMTQPPPPAADAAPADLLAGNLPQQPGSPGYTGATAPEQEAQPRTARDLRTEYTELSTQAKALRDRPDQLKLVTTRMAELRAEAKAAGIPTAALSQAQAEKRMQALAKEIEKLTTQFDSALADNPEKADSIAAKLTRATQEQAALRAELEPAAGQLGLDFEGGAPAAPATPATPDEPAEITALRTAAPDAFKADGTLRALASKAWAAYNDFSDSQIDAAIEELAPQASAAKWRLPMLEAIRAARGLATTQGATDGQEAAVPAEGQESPVPAQGQGQDADVREGQEAGVPAQGQEERLTAEPEPEAPLTDDEHLAMGHVRVQSADGAMQWVVPTAEQRRVTAARQTEAEQVDPDEIEDETHAEGVRMFLAGDSLRDIAAALGGSHTGWSNIVARYGYTAADRARAATSEAETATSAVTETTPEQAVAEDEGAELGSATDEVVDPALESEGITVRAVPNSGAPVAATPDKAAKRAVSTAIARARKAGDLATAQRIEEVAGALPDTETKLSRAQRQEREAAELAEEVKASDTGVERLLLGDSAAAVDMLQLLSGKNGPFLMRRIEAQFGTTRLTTPKSAVEYFLGRYDQAVAQLDAGMAEVAAVWGEGFDSLPKEQQVDFARTLDGIGALRNNPAVVAQLKEQINGRPDQAAGADQGGVAQTQQRAAEGGRTSSPDTGAVQVRVKKRRTIQRPEDGGVTPSVQRSVPGTEAAATTPDALWRVLEEIGVPNVRGKVTVVQSVDVLVDRGLLSSTLAGKAQAFVKGGKAYFIADHIRAGTERAVVLHEIGAHLGLEKILPKAEYNRLVQKIAQWSENETSLEGKLARRAIARIARAGTPKNQSESELIAYFIEEAVLDGIDPTALQYNGELARWFRSLWASFKAALRRLGVVNADKLTAQDVVNLAYGAARIELSATYHGTAADFRRFDHSKMGTGEGAQAFGWGTYLAQRFGIAKGYWEADVRRKGGPAEFAIAGRDLREDWSADTQVPYMAWEALRDVITSQIRGRHNTWVPDVGELMREAALGLEASADSLERRGWPKEELAEYTGGAAWLRSNSNKVTMLTARPAGNIQIVDVNFTEDDLLDWDKPLSEQSPTVQEALGVAGLGYGEYNSAASGASFYQDLENEHGSDKAASEYLDSLGVKGVKFLDAVSRRGETEVVDQQGRVAVLTGKDPRSAHGFVNGFATLDEALAEAKAQADRYPSMQRIVDDLTAWRNAGYSLREPQSTANIVVFNDKNIYRVASMRGGPGGELKFSVLDTASDVLDRAKGTTFGAVVAGRFTDAAWKVKELTLGLLTTTQLVGAYKKFTGLGDALSQYDRAVRSMTTTAKEWVSEAAPIADAFASLDKSTQGRVSLVMHDATIEQFDPADTTAVADTPAKQKVLAAYNALPQAAKDVYTSSRDHFTKTMKEREATMLGFLSAAFDGRIANATAARAAATDPKDIKRADKQLERVKAAKARELKQYRRQVAQLKGPYFPLMRFGKFLVIGRSQAMSDLEAERDAALKAGQPTTAVDKRIAAMRRDAAHYTVEAFERKSEADTRAAELTRGPWRVKRQLAQEFHRETMSISGAGLEEVQEYISETFSRDVGSQIADMMAELYFRSLPEHHTLQRQIKREGIAGASKDMLRVFSTASIREAHYISRLKFTDDLRAALFRVKEEGKAGGEETGAVAREIEARVAADLQFSDTPLFDTIANVSYLAHLALSPAFYLMNMAQVPMITMPWLNARYTAAKALPRLQGAYVDSTRLVVGTYRDSTSARGFKDGWRAELDLTKLANVDERAMMQALLKRNLLDITMEHDLGAIANQRNRRIADGMRLINLPTHVTELANRSVTALAAYRLARDSGMAHEAAIDSAAQAVSETQLDYSASNAPRLMRTVFGSPGLAKLVFQFRKYQQGMLWLTASTIKKALLDKGASPEEVRIARSQLKWLFGTHAVMAGSIGLPMAGVLGWAAQAMVAAFGGGADDEPFDPEVSWRNMLADMFGKDVGLLLAKGLPAALGADVSKRVGLGDIASPLPFMRGGGDTGQDVLGKLLVSAGGAPMSLAVNTIDAYKFAQEGQSIKAAEKLMPIKGLKDILRGARLNTEGVTTRTGELALPAERFDAWDIAIRAAGFSPTKESEHFAAKTAIENAKRGVTDKRNLLMRQYAQAKVAGEPTSDIEAEVKAFNQRHPEKGLRIDYSSLRRAVQARKTRVKDLNEQGVRVNSQAKPFEPRGRFAAT